MPDDPLQIPDGADLVACAVAFGTASDSLFELGRLPAGETEPPRNQDQETPRSRPQSQAICIIRSQEGLLPPSKEVDRGPEDGPVILMVHAEPSWSHLLLGGSTRPAATPITSGRWPVG